MSSSYFFLVYIFFCCSFRPVFYHLLRYEAQLLLVAKILGCCPFNFIYNVFYILLCIKVCVIFLFKITYSFWWIPYGCIHQAYQIDHLLPAEDAGFILNKKICQTAKSSQWLFFSFLVYLFQLCVIFCWHFFYTG